MLDSEPVDSKKKSGLRGFFSSSSTSLNKENRKAGNESGTSSPLSHRFLLKKRSSRGISQSSQNSSSSSLNSVTKYNMYNSSGLANNGSQIQIDKNSEHDYHSDAGDISNEGTEYDNSASSRSHSMNNTIDTSNGSFNNNEGGLPKTDDRVPPHTLRRKTELLPEAKKEASGKTKSHSRHLSHLSLKRFLKKLKNTDTGDSKYKHKHANVLPHHSSDLYKKYGTVGKLLGTGASGSVKLVTSKTDPNEIFAVKKFRAKLPNENEHDYKVKVKNEFKIGQHLRHENLIHTIELIKESEMMSVEYYIVMEYCPYDFFNLVMSGLMTREECACYFKQIVNGVAYFQENGLAHRDLKLDNCVVTKDGILKLIDFGSAVQFRKEKTNNNPSEDDIDEKYRLVRSRGVVGSDPYLAPEVLEPSNFGYDARGVDVWSIAIMYCCMILKRFPWKIPKVSDPSYKSFITDPVETDTEELANDVHNSLHVSSSDNANKRHSTGPYRLLRLLPTQARYLIEKMLTVDPLQRYTIKDVVKDEFYLSIDHCHTIESEGQPKSIYSADNHKHHLVTEEDLQKINMEKERLKKLKDAGVA
ncbi:uncharacterized protein AC631_02825 [Debaryomyces fabryi]|uniref:non-specific serine/threonine protein kinase n=1 Tax=Debaryomyces fabryi TaxID=58627 RepID=A0A0V1PZB7_9ASCO|nr:uncharacterized protein AC631_02825 [Debaryomyces fabryi]KSA01397.1 hypothetical protein AC631_02825 [Debaryomyces fabryi]CUM52834.1 unnamed protein product [Debaryomyces fabryi]